jgi:uncharacterized SAM-binding protein YcdF (DUF218 family)
LHTADGGLHLSLVLLAILRFSPIGNALIIPLENRFQPWDPTRGAPVGIIVLGGAIDGLGPGDEVLLNEGAERLTVLPELARRYPNARILFSGGSAALLDDGESEAKLALRLFESLGVARGRIILRIIRAIRWKMRSIPKGSCSPSQASVGYL